MKKSNSFLMLFCIGIFAVITVCAQKASVGHQQIQGFIIHGEIQGITNGMVYLKYTENKKEIKDSTSLAAGKFTFTGNVTEPVFSVISTNNRKTYIGLFVENNAITITADTLGKRIITGSPTQDIYKQWIDKWEVIRQKAGGIYKRLDEAYKKEGKNPNDRNAKLSDSARIAFDKEFNALTVESDSAVYPIVRKNPNSVAAAFIITERYVNYPDAIKAKLLYNYLSSNIKASSTGIAIQTFLEGDAKTAIGTFAPTFTQSDTTGKLVKLSDFKGKYVLLDFWASWCGPCRKENPNVVAAYNKFYHKGFDIIQVSLDSKKEAWLGAINKDRLTWTHLSDLKGWKNDVAALYSIKVVPTNFLIDKNGKIIARNLRGEDLQKKLSEIFSDK